MIPSLSICRNAFFTAANFSSPRRWNLHDKGELLVTMWCSTSPDGWWSTLELLTTAGKSANSFSKLSALTGGAAATSRGCWLGTCDWGPVTKEAVEWWPGTVGRATWPIADVGDGEDVAVTHDTLHKRLQASLVLSTSIFAAGSTISWKWLKNLLQWWGMTSQQGENSRWRGGHVVIRLLWVDWLHPWDGDLKVEMKTGEEQLSNWHQYLLRNTCWTADPPSEPESQGRRRWGIPGVLVSPGAGGETLAHLVRVDPMEVTESGRGPGKVGGSRVGGREARSFTGGVCRWLRPQYAFGPAMPAASSSTPLLPPLMVAMLAGAVSSASAAGMVPPFVAKWTDHSLSLPAVFWEPGEVSAWKSNGRRDAYPSQGAGSVCCPPSAPSDSWWMSSNCVLKYS